jgi:ferrochelatase
MPHAARQVGVLLVNLGTPDSSEVRDVRRYLRQFLSDPRVIDTSALARRLLLELVILPFRPRRSAAAYASIWTEAGSPLLVYGHALREAVEKALGPGFVVDLGMRYGQPSIEAAMLRLAANGVSRIVVVPLFPQYASASTGSALEEVLRLAACEWSQAPVIAVPSFYDHPGFIGAVCELARETFVELGPDHVLLSFHGLPERQIRRSDASGVHCLTSQDCCDAVGPQNPHCYRAQCFATARAIAAELEIEPDEYTVSFQSRLGRGWIEPQTDRVLPELAARGIRRLAVLCPAFAADCLETLEEIGQRGRAQWLDAGGEELCLVPCVNDHPRFASAVVDWVLERAQPLRSGPDPGDTSAS